MANSDYFLRHIHGKAGLACSWMLAIFAVLALGANVALAQEDAEADADADAEEDEALELQDVRVTGSRLNRPPSELSGNLIVLDRDDIRASGELTLARLLRQLPQNVNATNETNGSKLNTANNYTGAATVNLRGLGSDSTLILVDGRRVGYSGILGGVTDISAIPLSMVDRIEILLDGASAVYGSDAVGGVVNIITRQDYSGMELDLNYGRPHKSGYDETRVSLSGGWAWDGGRAKLSYENFRDSGLDSSLRESIILQNRSTLLTTRQKNTAPGPNMRVWTWFYNDSCPPFGILWDSGGRLLTNAEYALLDADAKAAATCVNDFTLPLGFTHTSDLQTIDLFGEQHWGDEAEVGYSLRPEQGYDAVNVGVDQALTDSISVHANLRATRKDSKFQNGLTQIGGRFHAGNPFNPFGRWVFLTGLAVDQPPRHFESQTDQMFARVGAEGSLGAWAWEAELSSSRSETDTTRYNVLDLAFGRGVNSDGVSEAQIGRFFYLGEAGCEAKAAELGGRAQHFLSFGRSTCNVWGAPPDPINPLGDISPWIIPDVDSGSKNQQTQFEALARGNLFNAPGGAVALVMGYDYRQDVLDAFSEFAFRSPLESGTPTGSSPFSTRISRDNNAAFMEGLVPLVGAGNAMAGVQRLSLTFSGRYDSYSNVEVDYRASASGEPGTLDAADPGSKFTWSGGLVYQPADSMLLKANIGTSFVAPQLNQLLAGVQESPATFPYYVPNGNGAIGQYPGDVVRYQGGNDRLVPETADNMSLSGEFSPSFLPGVFFKAAWSDTEFSNRIIKLRVPIVDLDNLPSNVTYIAAENLYVIDDRWINAYSINRSGMDYELRYEWDTGLNEFGITLRRSYTNRFEVQQSPTAEFVHDLVGERDDTTPEDTVLAPIPNHQTSAQFTWQRGGLFLSFDLQGADDTRTVGSSYIFATEPATHYDMTLGYDFGDDTLFEAPRFMDGWRAELVINNITNAFAKYTRISVRNEEQTQSQLNPIYEWTQGRAYRLNIHKSF